MLPTEHHRERTADSHALIDCLVDCLLHQHSPLS
jgi:hypothetical protein